MWLCCVAAVLCVMVSADDTLPWWRTAIFYQVYPYSFKDSNGDGIGDLKGITQMASYFKEIGVEAIWLNPITKSPMKDNGYDCSDYFSIEPRFGTLKDFEEMVATFQALGIKVVFDFVPNHTSDQHLWFQASSNTSHPLHEVYKDFYVWLPANGTTVDNKPIPPNNWLSVFEEKEWSWSEQRQMFYLHHFAQGQPDLNFRNPNVLSNMTAVIKFWLDKGVDGFRMDAPKFIYENASFPNQLPLPGTDGSTYEKMEHNYDENQPETFELMKSWTDYIHDRVLQDGKERAIFIEVYDDTDVMVQYYGVQNRTMQIEFNFALTYGNLSSRPSDIKEMIEIWLEAMPPGAVSNWVVGNHDKFRVANRFSPEMTDAVNMLLATLPGVMCVYYGEEIGMEDTFILWNQTVDPRGLILGPYRYLETSRDRARTPMQWDNSTSAGFSTNSTPWLPVNPNYWWLNVEAQRAAPASHLKVFQAMAKVRKDPVLQRGDLKVLVPNDDTLLVVRSYNGSYFVLIINLGSNIMTYTSQNTFDRSDINLDMDMTVAVTGVNTGYSTGFSMRKGFLSITLRPKAAILLRSGLSPDTPGHSSGSLSVASSVLLLFTVLINIMSH